MSAIRTIVGFGLVAPVSVKVSAGDFVSLDGYAAGAGWIMLFDTLGANKDSDVMPKTATIADGTVPLQEYYVDEAGPLPSLFETLGPVHFTTGLVIGFSSTQGSMTNVATSYDMICSLEEWELGFPSNISATLVSSSTDHLEVWAEGSGPRTIYQLYWKNSSGADAWLMMFAKSAANVTNGNAPIFTWKLATGSSRVFRFGSYGLSPRQTSTADALLQGCTFWESSTAGTLTKSGSGASRFEAKYTNP